MSLARIAQRVARIRAPLALKLQGAFLLIIAVLLVTGIASLFAIERIGRQARELDKLNAAVTVARGLDHSIVAQEHLSSMFVLTGEEPYYTKLVVERQRFRQTLGRLGSQGIQAMLLAAIGEAFTRYEKASDTVAAARREGFETYARVIHVDQEHVIAHEIEAKTRALVTQLEEEGRAALDRISEQQRRTPWVIGAAFLVSIALAVALGSLLARSVISPIGTVDATLERIARGEFPATADVPNRDELGSLVTHLNRMSGQLAELYDKERRATQESHDQYERLRRAQAQLVQSERLRAVGEMAGGIAHDFNNLLAVVLGQAEFMLRKLEQGSVAPEEARRRLDEIRRAALDGATTVRRLLEFTRAPKRAAAVETTDPRELVSSVLSTSEPRWKDEAQAEGRHIRVVMDVADVPPVKGSPAELREVLLNLVFNAVDAMPEGGTLTLSAWAEDTRVCLAVKDTGVGIPEHVVAKVFEPFFTTKGPQASGLGLSVSYGIIRRLGGELAVDSQPGRGTTFTIRLPAAAPAALRPASVVATSRRAPRSLRVLVVDDEAPVREVLRDLLVAAGHRVWEAGSGREGLEVLGREPLDLVCTDLGMPGMTGWELADRIKVAWPEVRVALVTGWGVRVQPEELTAHGVDLLLPKPFEVDQVLAGLSGMGVP